MASKKKPSLWVRTMLWIGAVIIMLAAIVYQRTTGPTYPRKGEFEAGGRTYSYKLIRSDWSNKTNDAARVVLPDPGNGAEATLFWKRFRTSDEFEAVPMERGEYDGEEGLIGKLPAQPAAGKLEYYIELFKPEGETVKIPRSEDVVMRFKDNVPGGILWPHVAMMFFSVLIGMRAGLGALLSPYAMRFWAWTALGGMTLGGMVLGPIVQKYAFGDYWTGFPAGGDWTDNKMLVMWMSWVVACAVIGFKAKKKEAISRVIVLLAAVVMTGAYLIPHSMGGSELDYKQVDAGADPASAVTTGRK